MGTVITQTRHGQPYYRCGQRHLPEKVAFDAELFTEEQIAQLQADPHLFVSLSDFDGELVDPVDPSGDGEGGTDSDDSTDDDDTAETASETLPKGTKAAKATRSKK
ncbi:HI1506-related protein [Luteimonas sp. FXH3W]|uniref:HI1506-related protein n=1 Tax=Aquilutibacter rugosus TaxID=3115820 RepID=A0ABU7UX41_9GAMM